MSDFGSEFDSADLLAYVNAAEADENFVNACWAEASELVNRHIGNSYVPASARQRAILEVGSELFHRRSAPNGIAQFSSLDNPVRVARDPMVGAYPLLAKWVTPF